MSKERAHLDLDDNLDLSEFAPKTQKDHGRPDPKALETVPDSSAVKTNGGANGSVRLIRRSLI